MSDNYSLTHLEELEAEAIYVIREVFAQFDNPAILFSGGKDSIIVAHLARKAQAGVGCRASQRDIAQCLPQVSVASSGRRGPA